MLTATPFSPLTSDTTAVSVSGTTARGALNLQAGTPRGALTCRVYNATAVRVYIQFGDDTVTSTTAKMPIPAGGVEVFSIGGSTYIAGITDSGTGTVYATPGFGA